MERWSDGEKICFPWPVEIVGHKRYEAVSGASRTVLLVKPFDPEELRPYLPKPKPAADAQK